jgi:hypothetical protein
MKKILKLAQSIREELLLLYTGTVAAKRRVIEEDARRYGGRVTWEDVQ